jgi:TPR repeat protein
MGPAKTVKWYTKAAIQGNPSAQVNLGVLLARGSGTEPDLPRAYMWFSVAAEQGDDMGKSKLDFLVGKISSRQVAECQRLLAEWKRNRTSH